MKRLLLTLCLTTALHAQQPAATPHTFTSTDGRKLTASIIEKSATTVTLRRAEDGKDFILPLERLSGPDQALVKAWGEKPAVEAATASPSGLVKTWMLEPQWDGVGLFGDGLAPVKLGGKWGFIDETGKMVIPPAWDEALSFADGLAPVQKDGKWGYIDKTGKVIVELTWDDAEVFSGGAASVVKNGKIGFIEATGRLISEPKWVAAEKPSHGLAIVNTAPHSFDGTIAVINLKGETVIEQPRRRASSMPITVSEHGICVITERDWDSLTGKYSGKPRARFMNLAGKLLFEQPVAHKIEFHEGLAAVWVKEDQLAFIEPTGAIVSAPITVKSNFVVPAHDRSSQYQYSEGLVAVPGENPENKLRLGYMDKTGKMAIPARWAQVGAFSEGLALVSESESIHDQNAKWFIIDKTGTIIAPLQLPPGSSPVINGAISSFQNGRATFQLTNGLFVRGYFDRTGKVAVPPDFLFAKPFHDGLALVELSSLRTTNHLSDIAMIDISGAVLVPLSRAQSSRRFWRGEQVSQEEPIPAAASPRRYGLVNQAGKVVVPPSWDDAEILSPDLVAYRADGKFGLVNATGQTVLPATTEKIEKVTPLSPNLIGFYVGGKFGLLNAKGEVVLPATLENIGAEQYHDEQSIRVRQGSQWGLLDIKTGKITPTERPKFKNEKTALPDDYSPFEENKLWGVKAKDGTVLVAAQYGGMMQASKDRFWVNKAANETEGNWGLMTQTGQMLTEPEWDRMGEGSSDRPGSAVFTNGRVLVTKGRLGNMAEGGLSGYMDESGKLVVPLSLGRKSSFAHGAAMVWNAKESGLINTKGEWIFKSNAEAELSEIGFESRFTGHFLHGLALIETPLKWGFVKITQAGK